MQQLVLASRTRRAAGAAAPARRRRSRRPAGAAARRRRRGGPALACATRRTAASSRCRPTRCSSAEPTQPSAAQRHCSRAWPRRSRAAAARCVVIGHTDGADPRTARLPSAWHQSFEWAREVARRWTARLPPSALASRARPTPTGAREPALPRRRVDIVLYPMRQRLAAPASADRLPTSPARALLFWLAAPLLVIGGRHPFDSVAARSAGLVAIGAGLAAGAALLHAVACVGRNARLLDATARQRRRRRRRLRERFDNAMQMLRAGTDAADASGRRGWWRGRRQVYQLPWYVFIGAPGAGKTTALLHSGLQFPLAERLGAAPVAGIGGTRQCDWWFTDRAVFIDTAGRYTTQDSHGVDDAREWQDIHAAAAPLSAGAADQRRDRHASACPTCSTAVPSWSGRPTPSMRACASCAAVLGLSFPVYLMVTKADLLAGFDEFFGRLRCRPARAGLGHDVRLPAHAGLGRIAGRPRAAGSPPWPARIRRLHTRASAARAAGAAPRRDLPLRRAGRVAAAGAGGVRAPCLARHRRSAASRRCAAST